MRWNSRLKNIFQSWPAKLFWIYFFVKWVSWFLLFQDIWGSIHLVFGDTFPSAHKQNNFYWFGQTKCKYKLRRRNKSSTIFRSSSTSTSTNIRDCVGRKQAFNKLFFVVDFTLKIFGFQFFWLLIDFLLMIQWILVFIDSHIVFVKANQLT